MSAPLGPGEAATPIGNSPAAPVPATRKKPAASIFQPKKKPARKPLPSQAYTASGQVPVSGVQAQSATHQTEPSTNTNTTAPLPDDDPSTYQEFPIWAQKSAFMRGLHYHALRLQTKPGPNGKPVEANPYSPQDFTRPVRLHRRLARDRPEGADQEAGSGDDDTERAVRDAKKAERQAEREANQQLIAPTGEAATKKQNKKKPMKKVEDIFWDENSPKYQARSQLRYEEARPWHLEDFDGKNKWIGSYEEPLSRTNVMFEVVDGGFTMVPVEKWYKMVRSDRVTKMGMDQVEKIMTQKHFAPRWFHGQHEAADDVKKAAYAAKHEQLEQLRQRKQERLDDGGGNVKQEEYRADVDEIDFEFNDEFQDDDEGFIFGDQGDDDVKDIERRIREEMRTANLGGTGVKDEDKDWDKEEKDEKLAEGEERKKQKKLRRKLKKKELRHEYESDTDDENKYDESSDSEDSEEEREREEEERKKEEARKAELANGETSGASTKGTNTPNGRPEKKLGAAASLKRDADLSELSGNESSRKKARLNGTTLSNGARGLAPPSRISSNYASGSDTDTSRAGTKRSKIKLKNSPPGSPLDQRTPRTSRPGSPAGSRAQSPALPRAFPTLEEVKAVIPPEGVAVGDIIKHFKTRLAGRNTEFIALVKMAGRQDRGSMMIVPKVGE